MYLLSRLQKKPGIGRFVSAVTSRAALKGSLVFLTQTFRVSLYGFRNATYVPSGDNSAPAISGFPNNSSRSMIGGSPAVLAAALAGAFGAAVVCATLACGAAIATATTS